MALYKEVLRNNMSWRGSTSEPKSFICDLGPKWTPINSKWDWAHYSNASDAHTCKKAVTYLHREGVKDGLLYPSPDSEREVYRVSAETLLQLRGTHWPPECPSLISTFVVSYWPKAICVGVGVINHTDYSSLWRVLAEKEPGCRHLSRTMEGYIVHSDCFFIQSRITCTGVVPPTVTWVLPHESLTKEIPTHSYRTVSWRHSVSGGSVFSDDSNLRFKLTKI